MKKTLINNLICGPHNGESTYANDIFDNLNKSDKPYGLSIKFAKDLTLYKKKRR
jgi:hypothetical protein